MESSLWEYVLGLKFKIFLVFFFEFYYSNLVYDILGYVIEVVVGVIFEDYVEMYVLYFFGMMYSDFRYFRVFEIVRVVFYFRWWSF